ncbi:MAG: zeta toxin family protein [Candidatus Saganbacteria bacterium]|nr:zeta toxin family protein [Candidatus Saganbacteria bacterium]
MASGKEVYIVGGPNGAGKTTFVNQFLPNYVNVTNFVNADMIAEGISPFDKTSVNIKSGKMMLGLIREYKDNGVSFGFEITLAGKKAISLIDELKEKGYTISIFFLDISTVDLALSRVQYRVELGGHSIPKETILRRYERSRKNFWTEYKAKADKWYLFDNSGTVSKLAAIGKKDDVFEIVDDKYLKFYKNSIKVV